MSTNTAQPIAVIGMACRYPGAGNLLELWENILARRQQFREMPDQRLPLSEYYDPDPSTPDKTYGLRAAVIDGFEFDPGAYRIPRSTFEATDIVHWLALATALEAVKHAGLDLKALPRDNAGVILGNTLTGEETRTGTMRLRWPFVRKVLRRAAAAHGLPEEAVGEIETTMEELYKSVFPAVTEDTLAGGLANTIAGRVCNYLDFHGGGYIVDGACSSSLISIATAADYLNQNKMDLVIAGGVDISLDSFELIGFSKATALTRGEMRVYDKRGSGFTPGEGCGMVVLKRLDDARRDGDTVYAVLRGWGVSSDGRGGMTAPNAKGQTRALLRAYQAAGYAPQSLAFVEGHGTGTALGDKVELEGIAGALAAHGEVEDHAVGVTSFKSIVGHTKAAAGIGGFIKAVIAVNRRVVPPTAGCDEPHGSFADVARGLYPVLQGDTRAPEASLRAGISAMGFGGINCHVTIESGDPPAPELAPALPERTLLASRQDSEVIPLAAEDLPGLVQAVQSLQQASRGIAVGELVDLAADQARTLRSLPWRAAVVAGTLDELTARLEALRHQLESDPPPPGSAWRGDHAWVGHAVQQSRVGFLFPGQGSQQIGMARTLVERFAWARDFVERSDAAAEAVRAAPGEAGNSGALSELFLRRTERDPAKRLEAQWKATLTRTENAQPAICVASWAWTQRLEALGITPQVVGGHSLGELTALAVAGAYAPTTLVRLAALRGKAMATPAGEGGLMAVLSCDARRAEELLTRSGGGYCIIANHNSPLQTVISGAPDAVRQAVDLAGKEGLKAGVLPVSNAFHSRLVAPAAEVFRSSDEVPAGAAPFRCRVFSSTDGNEIDQGLDLKHHLAQQIVSPVNFTRMLEAMSEHCDWLVEVGPGRVLSGLVQSHEGNRVRPCFPVEGRSSRDADFNSVLAEAFTRGIDLRWERLHEDRLVRPFIPAAERKFYVNPCERPLAEVSADRPPVLFGQNADFDPALIDPTAPDLESLAASLTRASSEAVSAQRVALLLHDAAEKSLRVVLPGDTPVRRLAAGQGIFGDVFRSGAAEAIEILDEDPRFLSDLESLGTPAGWTSLYVPIMAAPDSSAIGVIRLDRDSGEPFAPADADIVAKLALRAAPALVNAYLGERRREARRIERQLRDILAAPAVEGSCGALLDDLVASARASLGAEHGSILLYDPESRQLYAPPADADSSGTAGPSAADLRLPAAHGIVGEVLRTRKPVHVAKGLGDDPLGRQLEHLTGCRTRTLDCVPLLARQGEALGLLLLVNRRFPGNRRSLAEIGRRGGALLAQRAWMEEVRGTADSLRTAMVRLPAPAVKLAADPPRQVPEQRPVITAEPARSEASETSVRSVLLALISERTGFAVDTLHDDALLIDDFNLDSIKIATLLGDAALQLGVQGKVDPVLLGTATLGAVIAEFERAREPVMVAVPAAPAAVAPLSAMEILLDLVTERTGFARDCLAEDQRLLDDLNIDSIKAASLLGDLILRTQTQGRVEAGSLANATLGEIAAQVQNAMGAVAVVATPTPAPVGPVTSPPGKRARWVRSFGTLRVPAPLPATRHASAAGSGDILLLVAGGVSPTAEQLAQRLGTTPVPIERVESASLPESVSTLVMMLSDGRPSGSDHPSLAAVGDLAVLHRLASRSPELWRNLARVAFLQRTGGRGLSEAPGASAHSFAASLHLERPELEVKCIDFDPGLPAHFVVEQAAGELVAPGQYEAVEYDREGTRSLRCIAPVQPEQCAVRSLVWTSEDVLLVTGGGKGITAECALAFARENGVKLALLGRSKAPLPGEESELSSTLRRLTESGVTFRYYEADVADRAALEAAVSRVRSDLGPVTGILHGAGTNVPRRLIDVSAAEAQREIAPKLQGAENLVALFESAPPKFFAAFTSIIGVIGMRNNAWYAYSNEAVARLLQGFGAAHPETAIVSYAFSVWDEVGMGVKLDSVRHLARLGLDAIPLDEGVRQFLRWTRMAPPTPAQEVIVSASAGKGLATWVRPSETERPIRRFDGELQHFEPGIESVTRVKLDAKLDLYLKDHDYRGSLLLPTVMGLEAMAEACLRVVGETGIEVVRIEDIQLERPIVVSPERPATIEIRALVRERISNADPVVVETSIHTEQTGMEPAHFAARFVLGRRAEADAGVQLPPFAGLLGIVPQADLYGGVLFQGPLFQRISAIESLDDHHVVFATEARARTVEAPEGFADEVRAPLVLGDPYYRDTLLQAAQLSLTPEICLPIRVGRIDIFAAREPGGHYRAEAKVVGRNGDRVLGEVQVFDEGGRLIERISGYEVKVLEKREDFPTPAILVSQALAAGSLALQHAIEERARHGDWSGPAAVIRHIPGMHAKPREQRRTLSRPLFHAALGEARQRLGVDTEALDVTWLESGKPVLIPAQDPDEKQRARLPDPIEGEGVTPALGVSLSHDDEFVLCVAGSGHQGCDLVAPVHRDREQWRAMLNEPLFALVARLESEGETLDQAGARVWSALEAAMKALDTRDFTLDVEDRAGDAVVFAARHETIQLRVLTFATRLAGAHERMVAVVVDTSRSLALAAAAEQPPVQDSSPAVSGELSRERVSAMPAGDMALIEAVRAVDFFGGQDPAEFLGVQAEMGSSGTDRQVTFRFPLAFKDGANPDGTLYFVRLFEWMGRLREMALRPVLGRLAGEFTSGEHAWVTNRSWGQIERPVYAGEVMEVAARFLGRTGPDDAMVAVGFDWNRVAAGGIERVATTQIQMTWARVLSHGVVTPEPYPSYLDHFFRSLTSPADTLAQHDAVAYRRALARLGTSLWRARPGPSSGMLLDEQAFLTSTNDANLVGNIYYTKYYELQGVLRDRYLFGLVPEAYQAGGPHGGIRCLFTEVRHLRDAMPFDALRARMRIIAVHERGMELGFDFFRTTDMGKLEKLATATHVAAWIENPASPEAVGLPVRLREHLLDLAHESLPVTAFKTAA